MYWDEQPDDPRRPWDQHLVTDRFEKYHGLLVTDLDDDDSELVGLSQDAETVFHFDIPSDPFLEPWPESHVHIIDENVRVEGVATADSPDGDPQILRDDLFCPHSLQTAVLTGNGYPDIYVGEMGLGKNSNPQQFVFENLGGGEFREHVVVSGIPTHEAKLVDMNGNGRRDIVGKPYGPDHHVDVWYRQ